MTKEVAVDDIIRGALVLVENEASWARFWFAQSSNAVSVEPIDLLAVRWCAVSITLKSTTISKMQSPGSPLRDFRVRTKAAAALRIGESNPVYSFGPTALRCGRRDTRAYGGNARIQCAFQSRVRDLPLGDRFLVEVAFRDRCQFRIGGVLLLQRLV